MSKETQYLIHNTSRDKLGRVLRASEPTHPKKVIFLAGGLLRLTRGKPLLVTETLLRKVANEVAENQKHGRAKVTNLLGQEVDPVSFAVVPKGPTVPVKPDTKPEPVPEDPVPLVPAPEEPELTKPLDPPVEEAAEETPVEEAASEEAASEEETPVEESTPEAKPETKTTRKRRTRR